jgi:hypothetical protein
MLSEIQHRFERRYKGFLGSWKLAYFFANSQRSLVDESRQGMPAPVFAMKMQLTGQVRYVVVRELVGKVNQLHFLSLS